MRLLTSFMTSALLDKWPTVREIAASFMTHWIFYFTEIISKYSCKKTKNKQTHNQWEHSTIITKRDCYKCDKAFHCWHHIHRPQHKFTHKDGKGFWILFICLVYRISKEKFISEKSPFTHISHCLSAIKSSSLNMTLTIKQWQKNFFTASIVTN